MRRFSCVSVVCLALLCLPAVANAGTEEEVIKVTYAQWAAEIANDSEKSTRVYVKQGGEWMLVHANFAPVGTDD